MVNLEKVADISSILSLSPASRLDTMAFLSQICKFLSRSATDFLSLSVCTFHFGFIFIKFLWLETNAPFETPPEVF